MDVFYALIGYILGKYRLSKKLCSNYRPEFAKWSIYRPAIILWTTVDTLDYLTPSETAKTGQK